MTAEPTPETGQRQVERAEAYVQAMQMQEATNACMIASGLASSGELPTAADMDVCTQRARQAMRNAGLFGGDPQ